MHLPLLRGVSVTCLPVPQLPDHHIVVVDTDVIAKAPKRTLVSGFGDALSTYYEARTCYDNPAALSMLEARPTLTALAIGELSYADATPGSEEPTS